jgi:hypothetical protein
MECPVCKIEAVISGQKMVMKGNKLYRVLKYSCRNSKCEKFQTEIGEVEHEVPVEIQD